MCVFICRDWQSLPTLSEMGWRRMDFMESLKEDRSLCWKSQFEVGKPKHTHTPQTVVVFLQSPMHFSFCGEILRQKNKLVPIPVYYFSGISVPITLGPQVPIANWNFGRLLHALVNPGKFLHPSKEK